MSDMKRFRIHVHPAKLAVKVQNFLIGVFGDSIDIQRIGPTQWTNVEKDMALASSLVPDALIAVDILDEDEWRVSRLYCRAGEIEEVQGAIMFSKPVLDFTRLGIEAP